MADMRIIGNKKFSVVIPVFNSEKTLVELTDRIKDVLSKITPVYEIILVDDSSMDGSWEVLKQIHKKDDKVKIVHLQKNFGQHNATLCGLSFAHGDYIVTLDDDLQHPPEEIPKLVEKIQEGYSVVYGKFLVKNHHWLENFFSARFQYLLHHILEIPDAITLTGFVIYKSSIVKNMILIKTSYVNLHALVAKSAAISKITNVEVKHDPRKYGRSNYNIRKYLSHSLKLLINHSALPLIFLGTFGVLMSVISFCVAIFILGQYLMGHTSEVMGWNSLMITMTFIGGMILLSIAITGEYLRRILTEVSYGQQYVIADMEL